MTTPDQNAVVPSVVLDRHKYEVGRRKADFLEQSQEVRAAAAYISKVTKAPVFVAKKSGVYRFVGYKEEGLSKVPCWMVRPSGADREVRFAHPEAMWSALLAVPVVGAFTTDGTPFVVDLEKDARTRDLEGVEAYKRQRSMFHVTAGDDNWEPTPEELDALTALFQQAEIGPLAPPATPKFLVHDQWMVTKPQDSWRILAMSGGPTWQSNALWPDGVYSSKYGDNISTDLHYTQDVAQAVLDGLERDGFGGERKVFPLRIWISRPQDPPQIPQSPTAVLDEEGA